MLGARLVKKYPSASHSLESSLMCLVRFMIVPGPLLAVIFLLVSVHVYVHSWYCTLTTLYYNCYLCLTTFTEQWRNLHYVYV